ncbi:MAG: mechanosensitive ion channel family protein [Tannerella sp.]|jgi:miniconductance mechanosensitive channel|nr:mechanosensitive ion channel family protein [Tannerella sp.]
MNEYIESILYNLGIQSEGMISNLTILISLFWALLMGCLIYMVTRKLVGHIIVKIVRRTKFGWDDLFFDKTLFARLGMLLAPIVMRLSLSGLEWKHLSIIVLILDIWITFAAVRTISAVLSGLNTVYMSLPSSKDKPIKVFLQVIEIFLYCAAIIAVIGMLTGKDVSTLLAGLTAFAAILMLIFKDSILGLVAGVQLSANDMVRIGDWIVMPSSGADGDVLEINLTTVKVQNFDKTITTIPTYKLVSESFTNWRGMFDSEGRRIKRSIYIDINSIHYLTSEEFDILKDSALLNEYMQQKLKDLEDFNAKCKNPLDKRRLTNIGTFREYLESWLSNNPDINQGMTHMIRQLQPTPMGVPLEIYCFSARQNWIEYENIQSDIFDHIFAILDLFHLKAFQYSSSAVPVES